MKLISSEKIFFPGLYLLRSYAARQVSILPVNIFDAGVSGLYYRVEEQRKKKEKSDLLISRMRKLLKIEI